MTFRTLPSGDKTLVNVTLPSGMNADGKGLERTTLSITGGRLGGAGGTQIDMMGAMVFPAFVDMHTHLDKGHIWPRSPNPDGSFPGALETVSDDRTARWSAEDVRTRMNFSLRAAHAHGTRAIRTHLDSIPPQDDISWPVFRETRADWAGKIDLQAACLVGVEDMDPDGPFRTTADIVAASDGVLGMVTYPTDTLREKLRAFFRMAADRGLSCDFHVDETGDPEVATLRVIAETILETGFDAPVVAGHCCSLAVQDRAEADRTMDLVAEAGIHVVSLPMCNMYLQNRAPAPHTPIWRGITLVHELKARGVNVSFASDNTRDPFYAYGDLDMVEVMREATRIAHLDHADPSWLDAFLAGPARACGFDAPSLDAGAPADLVICRARSWSELFARPQSDRIVLRDGDPIDTSLPDYAELDHLMEPK